jgi:hypothetical protein
MKNKDNVANTAVHQGPPLSVLAIVYVLLFVASQVVNSLMTSGPQNLNPYNPIEQAQLYYTQYAYGIRVFALFLFATMIPLGLFTATAVSRLRFHRINAAGVHIALFGGVTAAIFLGISGLFTWSLSQPGVATDVGAMRVAQLLSFASGGFGHVAAVGLLMAGISIPCLFTRLIPRWICWLGLIVAAICELSILSMIFPQLSILLPLGRFPSLIWLIAVGFTLPKVRRSTDEHGAPVPLRSAA